MYLRTSLKDIAFIFFLNVVHSFSELFTVINYITTTLVTIYIPLIHDLPLHASAI